MKKQYAILDEKLDEKLELIKKDIADIKSNQETILSFINQAIQSL